MNTKNRLNQNIKVNAETILHEGNNLTLLHYREMLKLKETFGQALMDLRNEHGISREQMGAMIGLGRGSITAIELVKTGRTFSFEKIAQVYDAYLRAIKIMKMNPDIKVKKGKAQK
jgi:DNA-binding XRE family transcriptional regulator